MTPKELEKIGKKLFGNRWQTKLAKKIGVDPRTVRFWKAKQRNMSEPTERLLRSFLNEI